MQENTDQKNYEYELFLRSGGHKDIRYFILSYFKESSYNLQKSTLLYANICVERPGKHRKLSNAYIYKN